MNKERRNKVRAAVEMLKVASEQLEKIKDDEEFAFDNMPENLQYSQRGEDSQEAIDSLEEAIDGLEEVIDSLEGVL